MSDPSTPIGPSVAEVTDRVGRLWDRIERAGGDRDRVRLVAVTKTFPFAVVDVALQAGLRDLGENYAQELVAKAKELAEVPANEGSRVGDEVQWHFIGGLQRNKVKQIAPYVGWWHSVDRPSLVTEIARRTTDARILIQVNTTGESQKSGCLPSETESLVALASEAGLKVLGLMTVGPTDGGDPSPSFRELRRQADELGLVQCSMGMTADIEQAIEAGSTVVRVGTAIFGSRTPSKVSKTD